MSKFQTPRYEQKLPFRHYDTKRGYPTPDRHVKADRPYLIETVVIRRAKTPVYRYSACGKRRCHTTQVVTYKDIYSDGSYRVWKTHG